VELRAQDLVKRKLERSANFWAQGLMHKLLETVHQQQLYHNATVHLKIRDGMTALQHKVILVRIAECLEIDLEDLLKENGNLLYSDFERLATGKAKDTLEWVAEMDLAMGMAEKVANGSCQALCTREPPEYANVQICRWPSCLICLLNKFNLK
jgi:hypothetical protein